MCRGGALRHTRDDPAATDNPLSTTAVVRSIGTFLASRGGPTGGTHETLIAHLVRVCALRLADCRGGGHRQRKKPGRVARADVVLIMLIAIDMVAKPALPKRRVAPHVRGHMPLR